MSIFCKSPCNYLRNSDISPRIPLYIYGENEHESIHNLIQKNETTPGYLVYYKVILSERCFQSEIVMDTRSF